MRVSLAFLLAFGLTTAVHCKDEPAQGTSDNPYPEEDGPDDEDGAAEASEEEEGDDIGAGTGVHEDKGEQSTVTADHLRKLHKTMDKDKDGKVALDEVMEHGHHMRKAVVTKEIAGIFDEIESTKDGHLSMEEHLAEIGEFHEGSDEEKAHQKAHDIAKFKAADVNKDDKLDKEELVHMMYPDTHPEVLDLHTKEDMRKRDENKDGKLSKEEWTKDATPGEHEDPDKKHDPSGDFEKLDEDKNGFISFDELRHWESGLHHRDSAMRSLLVMADKDKDGKLTADELAGVADELDGHDSHAHIMEWVFHESDEL